MSELISQNLNMIFTSPKGDTVHALKDVNFTLKKGELLTVLGPSGCGKTTLLNITAGFLRPTSGIISLGGNEINGPGVERGMVFQQGALFEWLTVAENVNFGLRMKKEDPIKTAKKVEEWLDIVGLQGFGNTPTYQLSGGMQQRVALARCLINDPDLILMDEPLGALDALTREKMQGLVLKIWKETGKTIILITHSVEEALLLGERVYVMAPRPGRIHKEYKLPLDINENEVMSGGFVKETYQAAWWAFSTTNTFEDCIIKAVNRGHDADTTGAVAGMIAGRHYGYHTIPDYFKDNLMWYDELFQTALDLSNINYKDARDD